MGDWLINYQDGFIRRGLIGELAYSLASYFKTNPGIIVLYLQIILYFLFFIFTYLNLIKQKNIMPYWLLIFSPFIFYFQVFDPGGGFRKEIIFFSILAFTVWSANTYKGRKLENIFILILTFYPLIILCHEMLAIFLPYILIVYIVKIPLNKKRLLYLVPLLLISAYALWISINNHVDSSNISTIIKSLEVSGYKPMKGAIDWLDKDLVYGINIVKNKIETHSYIKIYFYVILLALLAFIPLFKKFKKLFKDRLILSLLLSILIGTGALFIIASDWGRFIYINLVALFLLSLLIDKDTTEEKHTCTPIFLLLFSIVYFSIWKIPHFYKPQYIMPNMNITNIEILLNNYKTKKTDITNIKLVQPKKNIKYHIDGYEKSRLWSAIHGWSYIDTLPNKETKKYIVLTRKKHQYIIKTKVILRPDVSKYFNIKDTDRTGFKAYLYHLDFPKGSYDVSMLLIDNNNTQYQIPLNKKIYIDRLL